MKKGEIEREVSDLLAHFPNALQQLGYKDEEDIAFVLFGSDLAVRGAAWKQH